MAESLNLPTGQSVPLALRAYCCFAIGVTLFHICLLVAADTAAAVIPFFGWANLAPYAFSIFFACYAASSPEYCRAINAVRSFLILGIALGLFDFLWGFGREDFGNPYLCVSPWRPLFTALPLIGWLLLLRSKTVADYIEVKSAPDSEN